MNPYQTLALLPYILSLGISAALGVYCLRRQSISGARAYGWLALSQAAWAAAAVFNLASPSLAGKIFWNNVERLSLFSIPYLFPIFTAEFIGYSSSRLKKLRILLGIVPLAMFILLPTDSFTHLFYASDIQVVAGNPFPILKFDLTPLMQGFGFYGIIVILATIVALGERFIRPNRLYRSQVLALIIASLIPTTSTVLVIARVTATDFTPFTFTVRNLIVIWALFHYRLFDIVPIARDTVVENISNPVIVIDFENRIIDVNAAGTAMIGRQMSELIGQPLEAAFSSSPELVRELSDTTPKKTKIAASVNGHKRYFDLKISPLHDRRHRLIGRVFLLRDITERTRLEHRLRRLNDGLEESVRERTAELAQAYDTTLQGWARALEFRHREAEGHSRRVTELTLKLAAALGLPPEECEHVRRGALLHDIGKMAIPDEILRKGSELTPAEMEVVAQHPRIAYELLSPIPFLEKALEIPYCHHERWDGTGYPRRLKAEQIPLSARIFAVADVWDSLRSDQLYREAWTTDATVRYMQAQAGAIFDPHVLSVFLDFMTRGEA